MDKYYILFAEKFKAKSSTNISLEKFIFFMVYFRRNFCLHRICKLLGTTHRWTLPWTLPICTDAPLSKVSLRTKRAVHFMVGSNAVIDL